MDKLHSTFRKITVSKYSVFILFFLIMLIVLLPAQLWPGSDDGVYLEQLERMGLLEWVWWRATTWIPRMVSDFLLATFRFNMPIWRVVTALVTTGLILIGAMVADRGSSCSNDSKILFAINCCSFWVIFPHVLSASICWYTGSFFYIWPALFLLTALVPFYCALTGSPIRSKLVLVLAVVCSALAPYMEQTAAILICYGGFTIIVLLILKEKVPAYLIAEMILAIINVGIYLSIGGTEIRESAELYWYKTFPMLTLLDKVFQGVNWANYQLFNASNILMLVFTLFIFLKFYYTYQSAVIKVLAVIPVIFVAIGLIPFDAIFSRVANVIMFANADVYGGIYSEYVLPLGTYAKYMLNPMVARPENWGLGTVSLLPGFLCFAIVLYTGGLLYASYRDKRAAIANTVLYFAALCSAYALSISPTIFASGHRIFFVTDILLVMLIGLQFRELQNTISVHHKKWFKNFLILYILIAACFAAIQLAYNLSGIPRY